MDALRRKRIESTAFLVLSALKEPSLLRENNHVKRNVLLSLFGYLTGEPLRISHEHLAECERANDLLRREMISACP